MKILAIISEFNPFHNGHRYIIKRARAISRCDRVLCIMSGSFTQRGDICITDKYTRAKHAIAGGADCVIQLPAAFAVAPAEIFARGALKLLSSIPDVCYLAFGCENDDKREFLKAADLLIDESEEFKTVIGKGLTKGESYIKAYTAAFTACGGNGALVSSPNNTLALEYVKAIKRLNASIDILPVKRIGGGYHDGSLKCNYSSASAIRNNLHSKEVKNNLPEFVYNDMPADYSTTEYESLLRNYLFKAEEGNLKRIFGCAEGLEHKLKGLENLPFNEIIQNATSKRYTSSRIKRILCANALELYADEVKNFIEGDLYIKPLAVKKEFANEILRALAYSAYPVITDANPDKLYGTARQCFERDKAEFSLFNHISRTKKKDYMILV